MDDEKHEGINYANFEYVKTLGRGTHGTVILAQSKINKKKYAIKSIKKQSFNDKKQLSLIKREVEIMANLCHPHIITVHDVCESNTRVTMTLEYASNGELFDYVNGCPGGLESAEVRRLFSQIVSAAAYMHRNGVVHRDLKLENILLDVNNDAKIADFGLASVYSRDKLMFTYCGSPLYASPEIIQAQPYYGPEVDCWSLGVILYAMSFGSMPFDGGNVNKLRSSIIHGVYNVPLHAHPELNNLIHSLLQPDVDRRLITKQIVNHPWIMNINIDDDDIGYANDDHGIYTHPNDVGGDKCRNSLNIYDDVACCKPRYDGLYVSEARSSCKIKGCESKSRYHKSNNSKYPQHVDDDLQHVAIESPQFRQLLKQQLDKFSTNKNNYSQNNNHHNNNYNNNIYNNYNQSKKGVNFCKRKPVLENFDSLESLNKSDDHPFTTKHTLLPYKQANSSDCHAMSHPQSEMKRANRNNIVSTQNTRLKVASQQTTFLLSKSPNSLCVNDNLHQQDNLPPESPFTMHCDDDDGDDLNVSNHQLHHLSSSSSSFTKPTICEIKSPKKLSITSDVAVIYDLKTSSFENLKSNNREDDYQHKKTSFKHIPRHKSEPHDFECFKSEISTDVLVVEEENLILQCNNLKLNHKSYKLIDRGIDKAVAVVDDNMDGANDDDVKMYGHYRRSDASHLFHESENDDVDDECNVIVNNHSIINNDGCENDNNMYYDDDDYHDDADGNSSYHFTDIDDVLDSSPMANTLIEAHISNVNKFKKTFIPGLTTGEIHDDDGDETDDGGGGNNNYDDDDRYSIDSLDT